MSRHGTAGNAEPCNDMFKAEVDPSIGNLEPHGGSTVDDIHLLRVLKVMQIYTINP